MSNERTGVLELTLGDSYIGSAYSPQVEVTDTDTGHEVAITYMSPSGLVTERFDVADGEQGPQGPAGYSPTVTITDTPTGHTVTITDAQGPHSYDVPNYAQEEQERQAAWNALSGEVTDAISDAESATSAATTAATSATSAATSATSAASSANTAAQAATTAASSANTAASSANAAATAANAAASGASAAATSANAAATSASNAADDASDAADEARQIAEDIQEELDAKADTHGQYPSLSVGRADALTGADETAQWATRVTAGSGAATVRSVQGAAVVWNQQLKVAAQTVTSNDVEFVFSTDGTITANGTASANANGNQYGILLESGHVYIFKGCPSGGSDFTHRMYLISASVLSSTVFDYGSGVRFTTIATGGVTLVAWVYSGITATNLTFRPQLFDLTQMFGAGNEPATVAEFERMYPEAYYPYSAPTLKPVQISGMQSVGFNQCHIIRDDIFINGATQKVGGIAGGATAVLEVLPNTDYCLTYTGGNRCIIAGIDSMTPAVGDDARTIYVVTQRESPKVFNSGSNRYVACFVATSDAPASDVCVNISNPALNGTYKPYMTDSVEWPTQTLRAAGSVADMLYSDHVDVRVGVVDMGTLTWSYSSSRFQAALSDGYVGPTRTPVMCSDTSYVFNASGSEDYTMFQYNNAIFVYNSTFGTDAAAFKAAMNGVMLHYTLATTTTTPISPALPMTYRVEQGGTETIIVPTGEVSAAPVLTVAEGESAAELVMDALACIAAPDGPTAKANHAANTYLTMQGKLWKVTSAIAVGESIVPNTNVTQTTVMAELIARTA